MISSSTRQNPCPKFSFLDTFSMCPKNCHWFYRKRKTFAPFFGLILVSLLHPMHTPHMIYNIRCHSKSRFLRLSKLSSIIYLYILLALESCVYEMWYIFSEAFSFEHQPQMVHNPILIPCFFSFHIQIRSSFRFCLSEDDGCWEVYEVELYLVELFIIQSLVFLKLFLNTQLQQ